MPEPSPVGCPRGGNVRRRKFLSATATLTMGAAISSDAASAALPVTSSMDEAARLADHLLEAFPARQSLAAIGKAYWRGGMVDPISSRSSLTDSLNSLLDHIQLSKANLRHMSHDAMRSHFKTQNTRDFSQHKTVLVEGWLLGETETRLCALAALRSV